MPALAPPRCVILVPYRPANDRHRWLYDMVRPHLEAFGWPIVEGTCEGRWARAVAVNDAARKAGRWDVAYISDIDVIPDHDAVQRAVAWVRSTGGGARPHDERYMLNKAGTLVAVQRGVEALGAAHFDRQWAGGGTDVVTREAFDAVGGFDERYVGWGYEDSEFHVQLVVHRAWDRLPGEAWHLWHPVGDNRPDAASQQMYRDTQRTHRVALERWLRNKGLRQGVRVF